MIMAHLLTTLEGMPIVKENEVPTNSDPTVSPTQRGTKKMSTTESSLIMGDRLPPMTCDVRYNMKSYDKATVVWNVVPKELEVLDGNDLWMNRPYLKRTFKEPTGHLTDGKATQFRIMKGPAFPICLLLNCSNLEDRLKVLNWWISLSVTDRQKEWENITNVFVRPTMSGKLLDLNGYIRPTPATTVDTKMILADTSENVGGFMSASSEKSSIQTTMKTNGAKEPFESNLKDSQTPDLVASEEVIVQRLQKIYLNFVSSGNDADPSILWQDKTFRHGILLLRCIYENFSRIPLHDNTKVLLICQQVHSDKAQCQQFCIYSKLRLRYNVQALCRPCQQQLAALHDQKYRAARREIIVQDKYQKIQSKTHRQKRRIKILKERVKNGRNAQFDCEVDSVED